jgi:hypothetical protein
VTRISRRNLLLGGGIAAMGLLKQTPLLAATPPAAGGPQPALLQEALRALDRHRGMIAHRDVVGVVDFAQASRVPRFHIVDLVSGRSAVLLVAHGRGSDPGHSGWVERFSNVPGSAASSAGAYLIGGGYHGRHGRSQRLVGLDAGNSNAETRAIVVHSASYVSENIARATGKLGRSEGCFAVAQADLAQLLDRLGPGRLLYAGKA